MSPRAKREKGARGRKKKNPYTHIFYQYIFPGASVRLYFFGPFFRSAFYPHIDIEGARCDMTCRGRETPHTDRDYVTRHQTWSNFPPSQTGASDLNLQPSHLCTNPPTQAALVLSAPLNAGHPRTYAHTCRRHTKRTLAAPSLAMYQVARVGITKRTHCFDSWDGGGDVLLF